MKIACVGKGGSGKTTLSVLLARQLAGAHFPVLLIDADINQHVGHMLGMTTQAMQSMRSLGQEMHRVKEYVRGDNPRILSTETMIKTTPPGRGSRYINLRDHNPVYDYFSRMVEGIRYMAVGAFDETDVGVKCYHAKTGVVELLLNHCLDREKEYFIVDMTAGADAFASGLFTRFDITLLVVEPTLKSVGVYEQYKKYAQEFGVAIGVVGNKIEQQSDIDFIRQYVGDDYMASMYLSPFIKKIDRGEYQNMDQLEPINQKALQDITAVIDRQKKDWEKYYQEAVLFHKKNAFSWANVALGCDVTQQIDESFRIQDVISR